MISSRSHWITIESMLLDRTARDQGIDNAKKIQTGERKLGARPKSSHPLTLGVKVDLLVLSPGARIVGDAHGSIVIALGIPDEAIAKGMVFLCHGCFAVVLFVLVARERGEMHAVV